MRLEWIPIFRELGHPHWVDISQDFRPISLVKDFAGFECLVYFFIMINSGGNVFCCFLIIIVIIIIITATFV